MIGLRLLLGRSCPVCGGRMDADEFVERSALIALFGVAADPYAVCPSCRQEVAPDQVADPGYRRRARCFYFGRGIVLRADLAGVRWAKADAVPMTEAP